MILVSTSFLSLQGSIGDTEAADRLSDPLDDKMDTSSSSRLTSRVYDWSQLVAEDGLVDVIVTVDGFIPADSKASKAIEKVASSEKARIYRSIEGLSARITMTTLEELLALEGSGITVYPDVTVTATEFDSITQVGSDQVWTRTDPYGRLVTGFGIVVAVIDTGVDYTHPDLGGAFGPTYKVIGGYDFYNSDADPIDDNGHGTHVAGVIAANGVMKGVAPAASILAYKVLGYDGSGPMSNVIAAIELATDPNSDGNTADHADVISMSLGGPGDPSDPVCTAIANAVSEGVVVVVAAGNDGPSLGTVASPGVSPYAITVGAIDSSGVLAEFSSRGMIPDLSIKPEISAPGVSVMSTVPYSGTAHSSVTGYASLSGTSMATPHVSGGAALMLQMHPDWNPEMVKSALVSGASKLNESVWCAGSGGLWLPKSADSKLFFEPAIVSYGLAGGVSQSIDALNTGTSISLGFTSRDSQGLSADGIKVPVQYTNVSTVAPTYATLQTAQPVAITLNVPAPSVSSPEGYYDGEVRASASGYEVRLPFGFAVLSILNVHVLDVDGKEVNDPYGGVWLYSTPKADIALGFRGSVADPAPPATFLVPSGNYSVHAMGHQLIYTYDDPYVLSSSVSLKKLETKNVYLSMASARAFTLDLSTDEGKPIYVKDYRVYCRYVGSENNISFHLVGSDYSITGSELFTIPDTRTVMISDTDATIGVSVSGFSYTGMMWDFMVRNWQHWYEYASSSSTEFYIEASTDLQYLMAWEFDGVGSTTNTSLALDPSRCSVYNTKYDIPGDLQDIWGDWGTHRSVGGDAAFYIRRDTDTSLNSFFSGMTRTTIVQGVFAELYFPWDLFQGYFEREFYTADYDELVRADIASLVYLPNRNFLTSVDGLDEEERLGSGPFYPAVRATVTDSELTLYHPLLRDQSGAKVGGMSLPSMDLYKNGQRTGIYQIAEHLARPDAIRIVSLGGDGTYKASITYNPTPQICS
ncbi:MAG: S8 family serine peptidase, partial [Thermoplasmata archaeon]|nr:S8 family serine peptidase [Thermoplasmata archaeon]